MKITITISLILLFFELPIFSSPSGDPAWRNYTNGLNVHALAEEGAITWIGTQGGLVALNKTTGEMTFYNRANSGLPNNNIRSLGVDKFGNKWIGTNGFGLVKYDGNKWDIFTESNSGLPVNSIENITPDDQGNIWLVSADSGVIKFDGINGINYSTANSPLPSNLVSCLEAEGNGTVWIGTSQGLVKFDGNNWTIYNQSNSGLPENWIRDIAIDSNGNQWIAMDDEGLVRYDGVNWTLFNLSNSGLPTLYLSEVETEGTTVWIICEGINGGLVKYDNSGWTLYSNSNSPMPHGGLGALLVGIDGTRWVATALHGVVRFGDSGWKTYKTSNSPLKGNVVLNVTCNEKSNKVWIADYEGSLSNLHDSNWQVKGSPAHTYWVAVQNDTTLWAGLASGLGHFQSSSLTIYDENNSALLHEYVSGAVRDKSGNMWFANGCLLKFDGSNWVRYDTANSPLPYQSIPALAIDTGDTIWLGTDGSGLIKFDGSNWTVYNKSNSGISTNRINSITIDNRGRKWIASFSGIDVFDGKSWINYNSSNSMLPHNHIHCIDVDKYDNKWIGTQQYGLVKLDSSTWTEFNTSNSGIPNNNIRSVVADTNGNVWIGTTGSGLGIYNPEGTILSTPRFWETDDENYKIYPNPANTKVIIELLSNYCGADMDLFNMNGARIANYKLQPSKTIIELRNLPSGVYLYRISASNGEIQDQGKLVIH